MNSPRPRTSSNCARSASSTGAYCAFTSISGIGTSRKASCASSACYQVRHEQDKACEERVVDVVEVLVELLPLRPERPPDAGKREAPDRGADQRQHRVTPELHLEHAGRDRDERA